MAVIEELRSRVAAELDSCAVGRDHPVHRALVAGRFSDAGLRELARQQWAFHAAFPKVLAALAAGCDDRPLRARILADAHDQETGALSGRGRLEMWAAIAAVWGLHREDMEAAPLLPTTETMITIQEAVARRPFPEAWVGIQIGVYGESAAHMQARRIAMERDYGVTGAPLDYFAVQDADHVIGRLLEPVAPLLPADAVDRALQALRLVLHARWNYFTGIGAARTE